MRKRANGFKDLLATLWNAVAGWLFFTLLLIILIGGIGINRFINLQRAIATLAAERNELELLRNIREDLLALENASRYSGRDSPVIFLKEIEASATHIKAQLVTLNSFVADTSLLALTDSLSLVLDARTKQLSALVQLKFAQNEAAMPESLLREVEGVLAGKLDSTITIRLDKYIQRREVPIVPANEEETNPIVEQGKKNLIQQFKEFFGGKKKEITPKNREEISLTDSVLQIEPLQADRREEVRELLEAARNYNSKLAVNVQRKEIALRESGQILQIQLNRLTETIEGRFLAEQQTRSGEAILIARQAGNMLALISACGLLMGLALMLVLKRLLGISAVRQKQLEEEQKKVAELLAARQELLGSISHELRTPLQALTGFANQLSEAAAERRVRWIGLIKQTAAQLNFLLGQLLQFNQLANDKLELNHSKISLNDLLDELNQIYEPKAAQKQLSWEIIAEFEADLHFSTDPFRLRQLLFNLLDNAIKFTAKGGVSLEIIKNESSLRFIITDTGPGMTKEEISVIFEPYAQKKQKSDVLNDGIGLGLHLVKGIVDKFAGQLELDSEPGVGTSFYLTLPVVFESAENEIEANISGNERLPIRLLVVDDDALNIELLEAVLENKLAKINCFSSPAEALLAFETGRYDVVLTDYRLPGQSGAEMAKTMKEQDPDCVFYLMTAAIHETEASELLGSTFSCLLNKPFDMGELLQLLNEEQLAIQPELFQNYSKILNYLEGNIEESTAYVAKYKTTILSQLEEFEKCIAVGNVAEIHAVVHQLTSRLAMFELVVVNAFRALEKEAAEHRWSWRETFKSRRLIRICRAFLEKIP